MCSCKKIITTKIETEIQEIYKNRRMKKVSDYTYESYKINNPNKVYYYKVNGSGPGGVWRYFIRI